MKGRNVDPDNVVRSHLNERNNQNVTEDCDLVKDIGQVGLNHFPIAHEITEEHIESHPDVYGDIDDDVQYAVAVGWRRVLALRILDEELPLKLRVEDDDMSDGDLLAKSISDNKQNLSQDTDPLQRAQSVKRLKDMEGLTKSDLGKRLSITGTTVSRWLEPYNWDEDTIIHPESEDNNSHVNVKIDPNEIGVEIITDVRREVGGGELGVKALEYVQEHELPSSAVREAKADNEYDFFVGLWSEANERSDEHVEKHPVLNDLEPPEPEPEEQESEEPEQEEPDEPEQELDEPEESERSSEEHRIEAVLTDLYDVETEGERGFVDGILGYIDAYDLTADDVEAAREDSNPDSEESFMNQLHIRAGNVNRIHSGPEYDEIHGSDEPEEEEGNEEQNRGTSESTDSGSPDEPDSSDEESDESDFAGTEPGEFKEENSTPEDLAPEAETDSSDDSEEIQGESDTEYTPVVQERSMDSTEDSDEELPDTMDPVDILNQPTDEKVRQKAKEAGYETPDDLVEDMYNIEFGSDGKSQTMREAMGEEAFQDFVEFKMDTQQVHREWNEDPLISKVQSHYKSFRNLRDVFERTPDDMSCPCCGSGTTKLEWSCCGVELGESLERHAEEAEENKSEALERMGQIEDEVRNGVEVESEVNEE